MKIQIIGYSGSGKSTLSRKLSEKYNLPCLHIDTIQFLPNWKERDLKEKEIIVKNFLDNNQDGWIIDGNYSKLSYDRRMNEADLIIQLLFGRINCLLRCYKRFKKYSNSSRPDMAEGCAEKFDKTFVKWILWGGRKKNIRDRYKRVRTLYSEKVIVIKNQKQLDRFLKSQNL